jgi:predicted nucleotidyltransferase
MNSKMGEGTSRHLKAVRRLLLNRLHRYNVKIYLFGSMARGDAGRASDIDVAILPIDRLPDSALSEIREELENSRIPYRVELVDLSKASDGFSSHVQRMGTPWNG